MPCDPSLLFCPNVTGDIGGDIKVHGSATQCAPRLLGDGGVPLVNGGLFGVELLKNVSITCSSDASL